jgi:starch-binding outer membrane protein, SusD/RagB family
MKIYKLILSAFVLLLQFSCSEDFLNREPLDELSPDAFFKTSNDLKLYANRFYPLIPAHEGYGGGTFWAEKNSDNLVPGAFDIRLSGTRTIPSNGGGWDWTNIRQANYFFDHLGPIEDDPSAALIYVAEVKFFKALLYFNMVKTFGDVPWFNTALDTQSPELFSARNNRREVVDSIIKCLDFSIEYLKPLSATEPQRISKEAAMLMKARIALYEGTWEKYHANTPFGVPGQNGEDFIKMAAQASEDLMQLGTRSIYKGPAGQEYWALFNQIDYTSNPEVIFWKKFDVPLGIYHQVSTYLVSGAGDIGINKTLIDSYLCIDGKPISASPLFKGYDSLAAEIRDRDSRLAQSIFMKGYDQTINSPGGGADTKFIKPAIDLSGQFRATTGYCIYKGVNPEYTQHSSSGGWIGSIVMRYAEALLIYAEAKAELGTITQADLDISINLLRDRVGMIPLNLSSITTDANWDYPELSPIINEVRRERRIELAFETLRWDDLARWRAHRLITGKRPLGIKYIGSDLEDTYEDYLGNPTIILGQNLFVDENGFIDPYQTALPNGFGFNPGRDYLSPVPSDEVTLNHNLVQNPGWD